MQDYTSTECREEASIVDRLSQFIPVIPLCRDEMVVMLQLFEDAIEQGDPDPASRWHEVLADFLGAPAVCADAGDDLDYHDVLAREPVDGWTPVPTEPRQPAKPEPCIGEGCSRDSEPGGAWCSECLDNVTGPYFPSGLEVELLEDEEESEEMTMFLNFAGED